MDIRIIGRYYPEVWKSFDIRGDYSVLLTVISGIFDCISHANYRVIFNIDNIMSVCMNNILFLLLLLFFRSFGFCVIMHTSL